MHTKQRRRRRRPQLRHHHRMINKNNKLTFGKKGAKKKKTNGKPVFVLVLICRLLAAHGSCIGGTTHGAHRRCNTRTHYRRRRQPKE